MSWYPRPEDHVFNRVLRERFARGFLRGFYVGMFTMWASLFALHLAGYL